MPIPKPGGNPRGQIGMSRTIQRDAKMERRSSPTPESNLHWWTDPRALLRYVLSLDDTPHHIALGVTAGMFIGLTPTVGIQMGIVVVVYFLLSPLLRFNCKAALVTVYISNPLTMVPLYWFDYRVGQMLLGGNVTREEFAAILKYDGFAGWWATITTLFIELGWTMCVGSLLVASIGAVITYPVMRYLFHIFRRPSPKKPPASEPKAIVAPTGSESKSVP